MSGMKTANNGHNQRQRKGDNKERFALRIDPRDRGKLDSLCKQTGWSRAKVMITILRQAELEEIENHDAREMEKERDVLSEAFDGIRAEVRRIGVNVNQVAAVANRDGRVTQAGMEMIQRASREINELTHEAMRVYQEMKTRDAGR
jgi:hypothetical protein